jgi:hypothetical protein
LKATAINASSKDTKLIHALIVGPRRKIAQKHQTLLEELEEESEEMEEKELDSNELAKMVANKVTWRADVGRRKKMQA